MKYTVILLALSLPLLAQEGFDFKTLDRLGVNAKNKTSVTLDSNMLKMASGFLDGKDAASTKRLVESLKGVEVRSFEFDREGQYNQADLEPLRAYLKRTQWNKIVESRENDESSEIYLQPLPGDRLGGVAIISAEPKELTVVYISGVIRPEDIARLSGNLGIPEFKMDQKDLPSAGKGAKTKKNDEE